MSDVAVSKRILTVPNLVSFVRLLGIPVFWWLLLARDDVAGAAWLILAVASTDWIDGYLARRLDQVSDLGTILDPVADRLLIASAVIGGLIAGVLPSWIGWGLIGREALVGLAASMLVMRGGGTIEVRYLGKLATFLVYGAIPAFYLTGAGIMEQVLRPTAWTLGVIGLALYWWVAFLYVGDGRARLSRLKSSPDPEEV